MWTKKISERTNGLSRELLGLILADGAVSLFLFSFLQMMATHLAHAYCFEKDIILTESQDLTLTTWVQSISLLAAIFFFVVLFFVLIGQKLSYIREITCGIDALRMHRMEHQVEIKGNNELTDLARSINYLAETERQLKAMERNLSHDIRTPLTAILSYSDYMQQREHLSREEIQEFLELTKRKAEQMKVLTERLMDGGSRVDEVADGRLLMNQLTQEWMEELEEAFQCNIDLEHCPVFAGQFDIGELRRIFDNLASNIKKYADVTEAVQMRIYVENNRIVLEQSNKKKIRPVDEDSRNIGLVSIEAIAKHHGGDVLIKNEKENFSIKVILFAV